MLVTVAILSIAQGLDRGSSRSYYLCNALVDCHRLCVNGSRGPADRQCAGCQSVRGRTGCSEMHCTRRFHPRRRTLFEQAVAVMAAGDFRRRRAAHLRNFCCNIRRIRVPMSIWPSFTRQNGNEKLQHRPRLTRHWRFGCLNHAAALNQQGMLLRRNGKFIEAEAAYLKAVTASPDYALAHYNLGVLNELYLQRLDVALQHFRDLSGSGRHMTTSRLRSGLQI